jgi:hypothetical protein
VPAVQNGGGRWCPAAASFEKLEQSFRALLRVPLADLCGQDHIAGRAGLRANSSADGTAMPDGIETKKKQPAKPAAKAPGKDEVLRARPVKGKINWAELSREHIRRYPKIRSALAK